MRVLLVYPPNPDTFWSFRHVLRLVSTFSYPPLGLLTIAALLPPAWELRLADLNVGPLRDEDLAWADYVMVSAMIVHREAVHAIALRCRAAGRPLIAGGPRPPPATTNFPKSPTSSSAKRRT